MTTMLIVVPSALFSLVVAIVANHWWGHRRAMATARSRASTMPFVPVPPEVARRFLATLGDGEWEVAVGRVLVRREVRDHEDGHSEGLPRHSIIYGWRDQRGTLRLEELERAVKNRRLKSRMLAPLWTDAPFLVAFEASSSRHHLAEVPAGAAASITPSSLERPAVQVPDARPVEASHVADVLARGAATAQARQGLATLRQLPPLQAWWLVADLIARIVVPETLEAFPSGFTHQSLERAALPLRQYASELRQLPPLPGSSAEVLGLFRQAGALIERLSGNRFLAAFGGALERAGELAPARGLSLMLQRWPTVTSSGHHAPGGSSFPPTVAILEAVARTVAPPPGEDRRAAEVLLFSLITPSGPSALCALELAPGERCVIGRAPECDVVVPSESPVRRTPGAGREVLSRKHAAVWFYEGQYLIEDLGSSTGTFAQRGQTKVTRHHLVLSGEEFAMANVVIKIEILPRPQDSAAEPARRLPSIRRPRPG